MKSNTTLRKLLALVLVFCLMAGHFVMPVSAAEKDTFNYVSLGASNTNGYGMRGYITEEELNLMLSGQVSKDEVNVYGYQRTPEGAYPDLIRDYYAGTYNDVNIDQLAISSMRVEELRVLLDDSYMGDDYTSWRFTGSDGWFNSAEPGGLDALRATYKESITNADLITVDIGWNNFGVYVCNQLVDYMSNGQYKWTTDITSIFPTDAEDAAAQDAKAIIGNYIKSYVGEGDMANALTDIFAYSILGYMHNFDIVMEKIYELNPDADVVVIGIQNLLDGVVVDLNGEKMPLGSIFGNFVNMANYYASACSPYQSKYLYVKAGTNEHVTIFLDYMKSYNGDVEELDQNVKDCFDYYDNDLFLQTRVDMMAAALIDQEYGTMIGSFGYNSGEEVVAAGKKNELGSLQSIFDSMYWPALNAGYDTLSVLVKEIANYESVDGNGLVSGTLDIGAVEDALIEALEAEIQENAMAAADGAEYTVDIATLLPDADTKVVAAMYIRYYMGNSFFAHPNGTGHKEIKDAVINVINNPESEKDQALSDHLIESVKEIHVLLCGAAGHKQIFTTSTEATCEKEGTTTTSCACGTETKVTTSEKLPHTYTAGDPVWAEDYTSCSITFICSSCGDAQTVTDSTITCETTKDASCKEAGETVYTADFSDSDLVKEAVTVSVEIPKLEHTYESVKTEPNCTDEGFTTYTCSVCGDTYTDDKVDALGHAWGEWNETKAPTCEAEGEEKHVCTECDASETRAIAALGHKYTSVVTAPTCTEDGYTTHTCSVCGDSYNDSTVEATGHSWDNGTVTQEPTETETGVRTYTCTVCQETKTESIPVIEHTHTYTSEVTAPTCTEDGYTTYTCSCGDTYTDKKVSAYGHAEITIQGTPATCTETGLTDGTRCDRCKEILTEQEETPALGHTWDEGVVTKEATEDEKGEITYTCETCGETQIEEYEYEPSEPSEPVEPEIDVTRLYGNDRCETAIEVADMMKEALEIESFDAIIIACGDNFADALAGSYLAAQKSAPILLYRASAVEMNLEYIQKNLSADGIVYLLGGTAAVPADVEAGLQEAGIEVKRLYGDSRFDTNLEILKEAGMVAGQEILVATGYNFADSLSASATGLPILMVNTNKDELTEAQVEFLASLEGCTFTIIGGDKAVSKDLEADLEAIVGDVERIYGDSREETSVLVAETYFEAPELVLLAYSQNFPDGLCGGPLAYALGAPLILTNTGREAVAAEYIAENGITKGLVLGGTAVISEATVETVFGLDK